MEHFETVKNTSGQGKTATVPAEIKKWNWGAFFLTWIWGVDNQTYIALLCLIPLVNIPMHFIIAGKGSEWAWQNKKWDSIEHFRRVQKKWSFWGIGFFAFNIIAISSIVFMGADTGSYDEKKVKYDRNISPPSSPILFQPMFVWNEGRTHISGDGLFCLVL